jgi:asparagine synthase (glutamine-hydrolysing)
VEQLRHGLEEAIGLRLRADVPVGCYLSGGIDSSSVLGMASARSTTPLTAFTVAFEGQGYDESAMAARTAAHLGSKFQAVPAHARVFADLFCQTVAQGEMVHYNAHGVARFALSRAVRDAGFKVVLAGEGADELFAGYEFSSAALDASRTNSTSTSRWRLLLRLLRPGNAHQRSISTVSPALARLSKVLAIPAPLLEGLAEKMVLLRSLLAPDFVHTFRNREPFREFFRQFDWSADLAGRQPVKQVLFLWMKSLFVNYVLAADRLDMAHGVEVRLPFLDHKLFELAKTIPAALLAEGPIRKQLLRDAVKPFVTDEVYGEVKRPFYAPPSSGSNGADHDPMYGLMQDLLRRQGAAPCFDSGAVVKLLDRIHAMEPAARAAFDPILFMMSSMSVLHQTYKL